MFKDFNLTDKEFRKFQALIYSHAGINLSDQKKELLKSRLAKRLRALNLDSYSDYYDFLSNNDPDGIEFVQMLDRISTNKTDFFRENQHFDFLTKSVLPEITSAKRQSGDTRLRIWSAGCSSGEEPYTMGIVLTEFLQNLAPWDLKILATDISTNVLSTAMKGIYTKEKIRGVPVKFVSKYFTKLDQETYKVKDNLKNLITFRRFNLMSEVYPFKGKFDVIFCRNVMIYFDKETQEKIINKYYQHLSKGGYFFVGHSESLAGITTKFKYQRPTIYKKLTE